MLFCGLPPLQYWWRCLWWDERPQDLVHVHLTVSTVSVGLCSLLVPADGAIFLRQSATRTEDVEKTANDATVVGNPHIALDTRAHTASHKGQTTAPNTEHPLFRVGVVATPSDDGQECSEKARITFRETVKETIGHDGTCAFNFREGLGSSSITTLLLLRRITIVVGLLGGLCITTLLWITGLLRALVTRHVGCDLRRGCFEKWWGYYKKW